MKPIVVSVTGAAGNIGYALLPRILNGDAFGPERPVILKLLEVEPVLPALKGVAMELMDCAQPLLRDIVCTSNPDEAFADAEAVFLVGAKPRGPGMERRDLLRGNGPIFIGQGQALARVAKKDVRVVVVGNPANTNCLIALSAAKGGLGPECFSAMTRLDHNRAAWQLAAKAGVPTRDVANVVVWGNHSPTMVPDCEHATIRCRPAAEVVGDAAWLRGPMVTATAQRGKAIIDARGKSSAFSAAHAALEHMALWLRGTPTGTWTSMAVLSDGSYGAPAGVVTSVPVVCPGDGSYRIVQGLEVSSWVKEKQAATWKELLEERGEVADLL